MATYVVCATVSSVRRHARRAAGRARGAPGSTIETFGTALWWAITTVTTVGYGDVYPVTTQGRLVAGVLMVAGVAFLGAVTATLSSWLLCRVRPAEEAAATGDPDPLHAEVARLGALLDAHGIPRGPGPDDGGPAARMRP